MPSEQPITPKAEEARIIPLDSAERTGKVARFRAIWPSGFRTILQATTFWHPEAGAMIDARAESEPDESPRRAIVPHEHGLSLSDPAVRKALGVTAGALGAAFFVGAATYANHRRRIEGKERRLKMKRGDEK